MNSTAVQSNNLTERVASFFANNRSRKITVKNQTEFDFVFAETVKQRCKERVAQINSDFEYSETSLLYTKGLKTLEVNIRA